MAVAAIAAASCDEGKRREEQTLGPAIRIVGVSVGEDRPMPVDGAIQIAFDRYLLPSVITRQSAILVDSARNALPPALQPVSTYDPITRTVTIVRPRAGEPWLTEGQTYTLILPIPEGDSDVGGFRAIDRATLFRDQKREFAFQVGPKANAPPEPTATFCRDVLPIFAAKCSLPTCHGSGDRAAAGLVLDTSAGVSATAMRRLAQGSNTGGRSSQAASGNRYFGVDMPIIEPGSPGNSWLLYKVELARQPAPRVDPPSYACTVGLNEPSAKFVFAPLVPEAQRAADEIERSILDDFILGREMPFPPSQPGAYEDEPLTFNEREKIRIWIQSLPTDGVSVPDCGGCGVRPDADAGASDAGTDASDASDAGDGAPSDAADQ